MLMSHTCNLITRRNVITWRDRRLATRSPHLLRFVGYLWWKRQHYPRDAWVWPDELVRIFKKPSPKMMQRHIEALESVSLTLVEYRSKTRGAWRLALHPRQVFIDRSGDELLQWLAFDPARHTMPSLRVAPMEDLATRFQAVLMIDSLVGQSGVEDGQINDALHTYRHLHATPGVPAAMRVSLLQRMCVLHRQRNDLLAWQTELAGMEQELQNSRLAAVDFSVRLILQQVLLRYDEGNAAAAIHLLERVDPAEIHDAFTLGRYHNTMGLASLYRLHNNCQPAACPGTATCALDDSLQHFTEALGYALMVDDYSGMDGICFNIGNAIYQCLCQAPSGSSGHTIKEAAQWIGLCEMVCHRFGVGGSSCESRIVLIDMALREGWDMATINLHAGGVYGGVSDIDTLLLQTLATTVQMGNRMEQAAVNALLANKQQANGDSYRADWYREQAVAIYLEVGRADKAAALLGRRAAGGGGASLGACNRLKPVSGVILDTRPDEHSPQQSPFSCHRARPRPAHWPLAARLHNPLQGLRVARHLAGRPGAGAAGGNAARLVPARGPRWL